MYKGDFKTSLFCSCLLLATSTLPLSDGTPPRWPEIGQKVENLFSRIKDLYVMAHLPGQGGQLSKSPSILFLVILVTLMPGWSTVSLPLLSRLARILLLLYKKQLIN